MHYRLFGVIALFFSPALALAAEIMFEGYYRIDLSNQHIGYAIVRYEFEPKDKQFRQVSFTRLKVGDKIIQESIKAVANDKLQPVSYQYTLQDAGDIKTIDGTFKGEIMTLKISDGKKLETQTHKIPKGTFFSSFLTYMMLQRPLPPNTAFAYSAIAEEEGASYNGKALIESKEAKADYDVLKVVNSYKGDKFISRMAVVKDDKDPNKYIKAEVLATSSPVKAITTELMAVAAQATEGHLVPNKILVSLFGGMPTGKVNMLNKTEILTKPAQTPPAVPATSGKKGN